MHRTKNDLTENIRKNAIGLLNARLADAVDLRAQVKQAHWTVRGPSFIGLHKLFDDIADHIIEHVDSIAERTAALGGIPDGTVQTVAKSTTLKPYPTDISSGPEHVEALSAALAAFGAQVRKAIDEADEFGDADTSDLFTAISRSIDQDLWFVEAHQQAES